MQTQERKARYRIAYIGNFRPNFSTENDLKKSFEKIGCEVVTLQEDDLVNSGTGVKQIIDKARDCDFVLYTRTWADSGKMWVQALRELKALGKPTVSFHLDLYLSLDRGVDLTNDPFFRSQFNFTADGGHDKEFKKLGINHIFMPPAILEESCYQGNFDPKFAHKVVFVGTYLYHKEWDYRRVLINWLQKEFGSDFQLYGQKFGVRGDQLNRIYASSKIVMGDSTYSPNYWSDRIPETLGRGGFLVHHQPEGLADHFTPYKHFIPYRVGHFKDLKEIIEFYASHDEERNRIKVQAMEHTKAFHTYTVRAEQILTHLKSVKAIKGE